MSNAKKIKTMIRKIVREEVAMAIHEVITELKQPTQIVSKPKKKKKVVEKKSFTKNSIINDVLNETAASSDEWQTMGEYNSGDMNKVLQKSYGEMMSDTSDISSTIKSDTGKEAPDFLKKALNRNYSDVVKAMEKK